MNDSIKFKDLKAGDEVFVVDQLSRWQKRNDDPPKAMKVEVCRVGRKYGYVKRYSKKQPFNLSNGHSHHGEDNARYNGYGFDVYHSEADYLRHLKAEKTLQELRRRLEKLRYLNVSSEEASELLAVLDKHGLAILKGDE